MRVKKLFVLVIAISLICVSLFGCSGADNKYLAKVASYSFWNNEKENSIAQYKIFDVMDSFLAQGEIKEGAVVGEDGKIRKVLFLGIDGARADSLINVCFDSNTFENNSYNYQAEKSGINALKERGGLYLAYAGGEKGEISQQSTSTCSGWTSALTGAWGDKHNVKENDHIKNMEYKSIMYKYAEKGLKTSLAFDWGQYFDTTMQEEVLSLMKSPNIDLTYCDIDRKIVSSETELRKQENLTKKAKINATSIEQYNFVANDKETKNAPYDIEMRDYLLSRINGNDDFVGGIFHNADSNGHTDGFSNENYTYVNSVRNADNYAYQLIQEVFKREKLYNEEWLIVMTADHGGLGNGHGLQNLESRTTWIASNKAIDNKYYGSDYNGYKEKK